jgi:hypothetical protein
VTEKRGPGSPNRHGGAPRGERPASWDARRLARRLTRRVMACPTGVSQTPERLSALRPPLIRVGEARCKTRAQKTRRGNKGVLSEMSAPKKKPTRAEQERAAAEQRRLAPVLREAHARLGLWRLCDDKTCRRRESCGGDADQCGARVAAQGWGWLHHVIKAMREGKAQEAAIQAANQAVLGYRQRCVVRWPHVPYWDDIEFVQLADGSWEHANKAPSAPDIDPRFTELAASPWLRSAVRADPEV